MNILIKSFQTYYKLPEYLNTECDFVEWTQNIDRGSSENLMCQTSTLERNTRNKLLETNKSFENLIISLLKFHFEKGTIKNFNNPVEYEDSFNLALSLANNNELQNIYDFSIYTFKTKSTLIKSIVPFMYPEVIYIVQFLDHIFKNLHSIFKSLNKATIKSYALLESKKPTELINKKTQLEKKHKELSLLITESIQKSQNEEIINKLVDEQNTLKIKIQELDNKITDINLKEIKNRIDKNLILGDKYMNKFVYNVDIITYLLFLNTETIPLELFGTLNRQLNVENTKFLIFLIDKYTHIIKESKICYITSNVIDEFKIFEQKTQNLKLISPSKQLTTLITSKTISPKNKLEILFTNFIKLSEPLGQSILYNIIQKLGFGNRLSF